MKKSFLIVLVFMLLLVSCGNPISNILKNDDYEIGVLKKWENKNLKEDSEYEVFMSPVNEDLSANVKIQTQMDSKIKWGRVDEVTTDYADKAVEEFNYTLVSDKYQFVPQAQREQRYELVFSADYLGQAFTVIQHIYAKSLKVIFVTGTYPENDEKLGEDVRSIMDSFLLAPKKGWDD